MIGLLGDKAITDYLGKNQLNKPKEIHFFYSKINGKFIDEIVPREIYVDNVKLLSLSLGDYEELNEYEIIKINDDLVNGCCGNVFWYNSLKYTVGICLLKYGYYNELEDALQNFEYHYKTKSVKKCC